MLLVHMLGITRLALRKGLGLVRLAFHSPLCETLPSHYILYYQGIPSCLV